MPVEVGEPCQYSYCHTLLLKRTMANRSSSSPASSRFPSRTVAIAGATVTLATAGALQSFKSAPSYEGSIQLAGILPDTVSEPTNQDQDAQPVSYSPSLAHANIAPPDLIQSVQPDFLDNSDMVATVKGELQQQGISIGEQTLRNGLATTTSEQGWLTLHYEDTDPTRVQSVLDEVAQWYESQDSICESQACRDVPFIESQIPVLEQRQQDLKQSMIDLQQEIHQKYGAHVSLHDLEAQIQDLFIKQHEQIRYIAHTETQLDELLNQAQMYQAHMNLSHVSLKTGLGFLQRMVPEYEAWLANWKAGDRELVTQALTQSMAQPGDTDVSTIDMSHLPKFHPSVSSTVSTTPSTDSPLGSHEIREVWERQALLQDQLKQTIKNLVYRRIVDMPAPMRELVVSDVVRFGMIEEWLLSLHQVQVMNIRRQILQQLQDDTIAQIEEWQEVIAVRTQLERELDITTGTLVAYQEKYPSAQRQAAKDSLAWQVVSPARIVQQSEGQQLSLSNMLKRSTRLMSLNP